MPAKIVNVLLFANKYSVYYSIFLLKRKENHSFYLFLHSNYMLSQI